MRAVPTVTCDTCGRSIPVVPDGRGFPPDIARRKLRRLCAAAGCTDPRPRYFVGVSSAEGPWDKP